MANQLPYCKNNIASYNYLKVLKKWRKCKVWKNLTILSNSANYTTHKAVSEVSEFSTFDMWFCCLTHWLTTISRLKNRWQFCRYPWGKSSSSFHYDTVIFLCLVSFLFNILSMKLQKEILLFLETKCHIYELCNIRWSLMNHKF